VIDAANVDGARAKGRDHPGRGNRIGRYAQRQGEVIGGSDRQDTDGATCVEEGGKRTVDGAVSAGDDDGPGGGAFGPDQVIQLVAIRTGANIKGETCRGEGAEGRAN